MKISFKEQCSCKLVFMCHFDLMVRFWNMFSLKKAQSSVVVSTHTKKCRQFRFNMRLCHFNYSSCSIVACKANLIALGMSRELKCYYDQKITFIFSSDFETMFIKHFASEIISLNFEKKTVNLNCNFPL